MSPQRTVPHILGLAWVVGAAIVTLAPALHHGLSLGPYDILTQSGLTRVPGASVRNTVSGDQIAEMIPWSSLAWNQVHHGHIPLWNTYTGLGLPLAFNWQSGVFSLPALISYILPLQLAYSAQIVVTLVIAGSGAYVLARVLGAGVLGCATAGTVYELSGSFMGWLGWPHAAVMSWAGWLFAVAILIVRGRHRVRYIVAFAVLVALALYAGEPEIFTMLVVSLIVFTLTTLISNRRAGEGQGRSLRPLVDLSFAALAGAALAAPLALPGLQVLTGSTRNNGTLFSSTEVARALPPHDLVHLLVQGYNGLPLAGSMVFDDAVYMDTATYVGLIALALAVLGVFRHRRRPETIGFVVLALVTLVIVYAPPVQPLFDRIPLVQTIDWHRDLMIVGLCAAILAGLGMDALVRTSSWKSTQLILAGVLAGGLVLLLVLWVADTSGLSTLDARLRRDSLHLPLLTTGLALVVVTVLAAWTSRAASRRSQEAGAGRNSVGALSPGDGIPGESGLSRMRRPSAGHVTAALLLLLETSFLVASGAPLWSSNANGVQATPAVKTLVHAVGASRVGFGAFTCYAGPALTRLGVLPESNSLFGLHEFDFYNPILPRGFFQSWRGVSASSPGVPIYNSFCPALTSAAQARRFGIQFVLEPVGAPAPKGAVFDEKIADEDLYRIPDSAEAELVPPTSAGHQTSTDTSVVPVTVEHPSPSSLRITTSSTSDQVLRLHLTDVPGWHATLDGRPLQLERFGDVMFQARIPAGHHVIELHYWPTLFTVGLILAAVALVALVALVIVSALRRRAGAGIEATIDSPAI